MPEKTNQISQTTPIRSSHRSLLKNRRPWLRYPGHLSHVADPATLGYKLYLRTDVKERIAEIQCEVHTRALMGIDEKRDLLRQMIEGSVPTKVNKRKDGTVEAVFDMLGALVADAKMAGEFDGTAAVKEPEIKLEFEVYHRNHPNPPRDWLRRGSVVQECAAEDGDVDL